MSSNEILADELEGSLRHLLAQTKVCLANVNHQIQSMPDSPVLNILSTCLAPLAQNVEALDSRMPKIIKVLREAQ